MTVATLVIQAGSSDGFPETTVAMVCAKFPDGFPWSNPVRQVEPITAMGVDYTRLRIPRVDYVPFRMLAWSSYADYPAAVAAAELMKQAKGRLATLTLIAGGVTYQFGGRKLYVLESLPLPSPAKPVGVDVNVNHEAMVDSAWNLQFVAYPDEN